MVTLADTPLLEELTMLWPDNWSFPELTRTPKLHTLRLTIMKNAHRQAKPEKVPDDAPNSFPSITTLEITRRDFAKWDEEYWANITFPSLHVLSFRHVTFRVSSIFNLIHCQPTVMEVNLSFDSYSYTLPDGFSLSARLEDIIKLIDGTGSWQSPDGDEALYPSTAVGYYTDDGKTVELNHTVYTSQLDQFYEDNFDNVCYGTDTFAFKRIPITPEATQWHKQEGSDVPRYQATELSIDVDVTSYDGDEYGTSRPDGDQFHDFSLLSDNFPALEALHLIAKAEIAEEFTPSKAIW